MKAVLADTKTHPPKSVEDAMRDHGVNPLLAKIDPGNQPAFERAHDNPSVACGGTLTSTTRTRKGSKSVTFEPPRPTHVSDTGIEQNFATLFMPRERKSNFVNLKKLEKNLDRIKKEAQKKKDAENKNKGLKSPTVPVGLSKKKKEEPMKDGDVIRVDAHNIDTLKAHFPSNFRVNLKEGTSLVVRQGGNGNQFHLETVPAWQRATSEGSGPVAAHLQSTSHIAATTIAAIMGEKKDGKGVSNPPQKAAEMTSDGLQQHVEVDMSGTKDMGQLLSRPHPAQVSGPGAAASSKSKLEFGIGPDPV